MKKNILIICLFLVLMSILLIPAFHELNGTFHTATVPDEYRKLDSFLASKNEFFRTLWVPSSQRYGFYSAAHPLISATSFFNVTTATEAAEIVIQPHTQRILQNASVRYIIVPDDTKGELFLKDRKYDAAQYERTIAILREQPNLQELPGFGRIVVFQTKSESDLFHGADAHTVSWKMISPTRYQISVHRGTMLQQLIFSVAYDSGWVAKVSGNVIRPKQFDTNFMSFTIPPNTQLVDVIYQPQQWVQVGLLVSGSTVLVLALLFIVQVI